MYPPSLPFFQTGQSHMGLYIRWHPWAYRWNDDPRLRDGWASRHGILTLSLSISYMLHVSHTCSCCKSYVIDHLQSARHLPVTGTSRSAGSRLNSPRGLTESELIKTLRCAWTHHQTPDENTIWVQTFLGSSRKKKKHNSCLRKVGSWDTFMQSLKRRDVLKPLFAPSHYPCSPPLSLSIYIIFSFYNVFEFSSIELYLIWIIKKKMISSCPSHDHF